VLPDQRYAVRYRCETLGSHAEREIPPRIDLALLLAVGVGAATAAGAYGSLKRAMSITARSWIPSPIFTPSSLVHSTSNL